MRPVVAQLDDSGAADGDVVTYDAGLGYWTPAAPSGGSGIPATILDAKGDIIAASAADTAARLPVGSNGEVLSADSAETTGLKWIAALTDPTTTKGDILARSASALDNLAVGTDGQVLTADSAETLGVKWETPTAGGGTGLWALDFAGSTTEEGVDRDRETAGTNAYQEAIVVLKQPIRLETIKWDIGFASTYTVTIDGVPFGSSAVVAARTADVAFTHATPRVLLAGEHKFRLTGLASVKFDDKNTGTFSGSFFTMAGAFYGTGFFVLLTAPIRLVAYLGDFDQIP